MTRDDALEAAKRENTDVELTLYFDPIGNREDWESEDESWGYCPTSALDLVARFRQQDKDEIIA